MTIPVIANPEDAAMAVVNDWTIWFSAGAVDGCHWYVTDASIGKAWAWFSTKAEAKDAARACRSVSDLNARVHPDRTVKSIRFSQIADIGEVVLSMEVWPGIDPVYYVQVTGAHAHRVAEYASEGQALAGYHQVIIDLVSNL